MKTLRNIVLVVLLLLVTSYFLFANTLIKSIAEKEMGKAHGAEVNIGDVDHSLFPATITLTDIQVTDPVTPSQNKVSIQSAFADVEIMPLLSKKLIANELVVDAVSFGQKRSEPGEVYRVPESSGFGFPTSEDIPSVDELLANSPLKTTKAVQDAQAAYAKHEVQLKAQYEALPDKSRIDYYKAEVEKLKNTDFKDPQSIATAKAKFDELKKQIKDDKQKIDAFRQTASAAKDDLSAASAALKTAPQEDYQLLQGLVAGDQAALSQVTQAVFGEKAAQYTQYLTLAIQTLAPMLSGETTDEPVEVDTSGIPNVWIKKARASVAFNGESIASEWQNITDQHALINAATTFSVEAAKGALWDAFSTSGEFKIDELGVDASQQWSLNGVNLEELAVSQSERLSAQVVSALLNSSGSLSVTDNQLSGGGNVDLAKLAIAATGTDDFTSAIADALDDLSALGLNIGLSGDLQNPSFSVKSDLDRQLVGAITASLTGEQQGKLAELRNKLNAKAADQLGDTNAALAQTLDWQQLANGDSATLEGLLETQLNSVIDDQKDKLLNKLKSRLGGE